MVQEAACEGRLIHVLATDQTLIPPKTEKAYLINDKIMKRISSLESPEGVVAEVAMPALDLNRLVGKKFLLALDGVADPGNMGTLLRTALALGWEGAYLLEGCCDPFNDKALRAAKGATLRLPLAGGSWSDLKLFIEREGLSPLIADLQGSPPETWTNREGLLLVLGNESRGPTAEIKSFCQAVSIPMPGTMESLNVSVAGGILMYFLRQKRTL